VYEFFPQYIVILTVRSEWARERMGQGAKGPGSEWARERIGQGANRPGSELARERIGQGSIGRFAPGSELARERKGSVPLHVTSHVTFYPIQSYFIWQLTPVTTNNMVSRGSHHFRHQLQGQHG